MRCETECRQQVSTLQQLGWKEAMTALPVFHAGHAEYADVLQIRCPTPQAASGSQTVVGPPHNNTLLDGEMVVDTDANGVQRRRFLAYDIMTMNNRLVAGYDFEVRALPAQSISEASLAAAFTCLPLISCFVSAPYIDIARRLMPWKEDGHRRCNLGMIKLHG